MKKTFLTPQTHSRCLAVSLSLQAPLSIFQADATSVDQGYDLFFFCGCTRLPAVHGFKLFIQCFKHHRMVMIQHLVFKAGQISLCLAFRGMAELELQEKSWQNYLTILKIIPKAVFTNSFGKKTDFIYAERNLGFIGE